MNIGVISQCSDLWLQFENRTDAWDFLHQLPIFNTFNQFILNYADFQFSSSSDYKNSCSFRNVNNFPSDLGLYAMQMLWSLGYIFRDKYRIDDKIESTFISYHQESPEKFYALCCTLWNRLQQDHCYSIRNVFNDPNIINHKLPKNKYPVSHAIITPLRILFQPMHFTSCHRAMRQYDEKKSYKWMLLYIRDEDGSNKIMNLNDSNELRDRYKSILQNGLHSISFLYKNLIYCYYGSSGSQMKKQEFWFMTHTKVDSTNVVSQVNLARTGLGNLKKIQNVATYIARVGLYLTTSKQTDVSIKSNYI